MQTSLRVAVNAATNIGHFDVEPLRREGGLRAVHLAARRNNADAIALLAAVDGVDLTARSGAGYTSLGYAAAENAPSALAALLACGQSAVAIDDGGPLGSSPLHLAAGLDHITVAGMLLAAGASTAAVDSEGKSPLFVGAAAGSYSTVRALLRAGADVNASCALGGSPLEAAARHGEAAVACLLLDAAPAFPALAFRAAIACEAPAAVELVCMFLSRPGCIPIPVVEAQMEGVEASLATALQERRAVADSVEAARRRAGRIGGVTQVAAGVATVTTHAVKHTPPGGAMHGRAADTMAATAAIAGVVGTASVIHAQYLSALEAKLARLNDTVLRLRGMLAAMWECIDAASGRGSTGSAAWPVHRLVASTDAVVMGCDPQPVAFGPENCTAELRVKGGGGGGGGWLRSVPHSDCEGTNPTHDVVTGSKPVGAASPAATPPPVVLSDAAITLPPPLVGTTAPDNVTATEWLAQVGSMFSGLQQFVSVPPPTTRSSTMIVATMRPVPLARTTPAAAPLPLHTGRGGPTILPACAASGDSSSSASSTTAAPEAARYADPAFTATPESAAAVNVHTTAAESAVHNDDDPACICCWVRPQDTACMPCGHVMCGACAARARRSSCQICGGRVEDILRAFVCQEGEPANDEFWERVSVAEI